MNSKRPVVPEGFDRSNRQLSVQNEQGDQSGRSAAIRRTLGLMWCFIGSALVPLVPVLACVLVAYGMAVVASEGDRRMQVVSLLVALASGAANTFLLFGVLGLPMTLFEVLCAYALANGLVTGRLSTNGLVLEVVVLTLAMIGVDMVSTSLQGVSIPELVTTMVNQTVETGMESVDLEGTAALLEARESLVAYWPTMYFGVAAGIALCSLLGAWIGAKLGGVHVREGMIARFDVPLWVAELFALGVAAELLGPHLPQWQNEAAMVGANVVMCARIVLAQQGLSVLQWWMRERRAARPIRTLVVLMAVWLEMSFALASVAGLLDVAVNFRRLERRRPDLLPRTAGER